MIKGKEVIIESEEAMAKRIENEEIIELKKKLFSIENKKEYDLAMQKMNAMYVVICIGGKTTIYHKDRNNNNMMSVRDARDFFANMTYPVKYVGKENDVIERRQVFDDWFVSPETERYESLTFDPTEPYGALGKEWNTWRGWKYEPADGDCSLYLEHIMENICNGDRILSEYIFDFMAQIIQHPKEKIFHAVSVKGDKGNGKTVFAKTYLKLFGDAGVEITDSEILTNQFNGILANRIMVFGDEAFWSGDRKNRGKLKTIISSNDMRITYKMKDTITMPNYLRFIFCTNEDWAAPVENGERRWVTLRCGNGRINDRDFFGRMKEQMENGGYEALMKFLIERDISKRDWSHVPITEASKEDMAYTTIGDNVVAEYLDECVNGGMEFGSVFDLYPNGKIPSYKFTEAVREYASKSKAYPSITSSYIASKLKDIFGRSFASTQVKNKETKKNTRYYEFGESQIVEKTIDAYFKREELVG